MASSASAVAKPAAKKRKSSAEAAPSSKRQRGDEEEELSLDFSQWAWQDTERAPLPSSSASGGPVVRWLGVQSLATLAGKNGKDFVKNAATQRELVFDKGYVDGMQRETQIVWPLKAPGLVVELFPERALAKKVLQAPSFVQRLEAAGADPGLLRSRIAEALAELEVFTPEEQKALLTLCRLSGEDGKTLPLRGARVEGQLVIALIDFVMLVKRCNYETAKTISRRLLREYWQVDLKEDTILAGAPQPFHSVRFLTGNRGGHNKTICASLAILEVILQLLPRGPRRFQSRSKDHLYVMQYSFDPTTVKIGRSFDVEARRRGMEAGHNFRLMVIRVYRRCGHLERKLHQKLKRRRSLLGAGKEWFTLSANEAVRVIRSFILQRNHWVRGLKQRLASLKTQAPREVIASAAACEHPGREEAAGSEENDDSWPGRRRRGHSASIEEGP